MASIHKEILVGVDAETVWDAIRDIGEAHRRLFQGVLTDVRLESGGRVVTFANGLVVHESTVDLDDERRRYAWTAEGGRATHYNSSLQVFEAADGRSRIVWITDLLPNDSRDAVAGLMDAGAAAMKRTLERVKVT
ncbi:MAG: SRPBCC family protein [Candidatus Cybelea sp.]|jgi:hypothetical protein